jgi:hypothetical protein
MLRSLLVANDGEKNVKLCDSAAILCAFYVHFHQGSSSSTQQQENTLVFTTFVQPPYLRTNAHQSPVTDPLLAHQSLVTRSAQRLITYTLPLPDI